MKRSLLYIGTSGWKRWPSAEVITAKDIYLRFHGPDGSYGTSYPDKILLSYAKKILAWQEEGHRVWAFFNNDGQGYALQNAKTLKEMTSR